MINAIQYHSIQWRPLFLKIRLYQIKILIKFTIEKGLFATVDIKKDPIRGRSLITGNTRLDNGLPKFHFFPNPRTVVERKC